MVRYTNMSITGKLTTVILMTSTVVLLLAGLTMIATEFVTSRRAMAQHMTWRSDLLGRFSTAPLSFHREEDVAEVNQILSALQSDSHILAARVYDKDQRPFGEYVRSGAAPSFPAQLPPDGYGFAQSYLEVSHPVIADQKRIGTIYLRADLGRIYHQIRLHAGIVGLFLVGAMAAVSVLVPRLRRPITEPIIALAGVAKQVSEKKDYSARAVKQGDDEIGVLTDAFNQMLSATESAQASLQNSNESMQSEITERTRAESALRHSEAQLQTILEGLDEGVVVSDLKGQILHFNRAALDLHGYTSLSEIRRHMSKFVDTFELSEMDGVVIPPDQWPFARILRGEKLHDWEVCIRRIQTAAWQRIFSYGGTLVHDADGQALMAVVTLSDITERKRTELAAVRLASIVKCSFDAIIGKDLNSIVTSWNAAAETMFGYSADEIVGRPITVIIPPARLDEEVLILSRIKRGEALEHFETERLRKDGGLIAVSVTVSPITDAHGKVIGASKIVRDITERKRVERELAKAKEDAEAANRSKSEFLANMSHEIRTPMNAILGFADMVLYKNQDKAGRVECAQIIRRNALHLLELINEILDLSKIEAGQMTVERISVDLPTLLSEIISLMRPRAVEKGLEFGITFQGPIPRLIQSDPTRLRQVLVNLLGNAIKFTEAGKIDIRITDEGADGPNIMLRIDVIDSGIGMTREQLERLFQPFTQGDQSITRKFGGTGLGLTISRRLAKLLDGDITVASQLDLGSTFTLTIDGGPSAGVELLQSLTEATLPKQVDEGEHANIQLHGRILLVEDGRDNQRLLKMQLSDAGAEVVLAANGQIGVSLATAQPFDLILMDMQMPIMDGYAATAELRRKGLTTPIIALTANAMAEDRAKCMASGCSGYMSKPIDEGKLLKTVNQLLDNDSCAMPQVNEREGTSESPPPADAADGPNRINATSLGISK